jgi:acetolactate synthase-1/2/3 large subunit
MVLITGQKPIMTAHQARFQIVDIVATMKPLTKASRQIVSGASIPTVIREAFRLARDERPGPVHLELPEDVAGEQVSDDVSVIPLHPVEIPVAQEAAIERAAAMLMSAERPLVMFGAASNRPRLVGQLTDFIRRTGIPFFNTQMGKGTVAAIGNEEANELWMGTAALSERDYLHEAIDRADLILSIGHDTVEKPPFIMGPKGPKVIHVGYTAANVEQVFFPHAEVVGDLGLSLSRLADVVEGKLPNAATLAPLREGILKRTMDRATESRFPLTPQRIVHDVRAVIPADGIVALDNGMYKIWFARCYRTRSANTLLLDNALATMGAGLPSAMMASLLYPGRRVIAVCGDGGFMMNSQELETAVRLKLNLVVLIIQDDAYGMIRWKQAVDDFADWGLSFGNPDFVKYAEAYGAKGRRVESAEGLVPTLEAAFSEGGVQLVVVPVDYSENSRVLVDELRNRVTEVAP